MKINTCFLVMLFILQFFVCGCDNLASSSSDIDEVTYPVFSSFPSAKDLWPDINNSPIDANAVKFSIHDLNSYWGENFDYIANNPERRVISLKEANEKFPIRFFRLLERENISDGFSYVVYPVKEGGRFFLLLYKTYIEENVPELAVSTCIYVNPSLFSDESPLQQIIPGDSTYRDVLECAPMTYMATLMSSSDISYTLIDPDTVAVITYSRENLDDPYLDFVVEIIEYVPIEESHSFFDVIMDGDLLG